MQIKLNRKSTNSLYTSGELIVNGIRFADTVESTEGMLDPGVYCITKKFRDFIGHGNSWRESQTTHTIIIGENCVTGIVTGSRPLYDHLLDRVKKSKRPVVLIITDEDCQTVQPISHWTSLKRHLSPVFFLFLLLLTGCNTLHRTQVVEHATHDTLYVNALHYDSIYIDNRQVIDRSSDTVYIHDILRENHYKLLRDTVRVTKTDSIPVIHEVQVTKTERYIPSVYKWSLGICIVSLILLIIYVIWKIKF